MEPAASIISTLGGASVVADLLSVHRTVPYKWKKPVEKGGTGGVIPIRYAPLLIEAARKRGRKLRADDFLPNAAHPKTNGGAA